MAVTVTCYIDRLGQQYADGLERIELYIRHEDQDSVTLPPVGETHPIRVHSSVGSYSGTLRRYPPTGQGYITASLRTDAGERSNLARVLGELGLSNSDEVVFSVDHDQWTLIADARRPGLTDAREGDLPNAARLSRENFGERRTVAVESVEFVDAETNHVEGASVVSAREATEAERGEAQLVDRFRQHLETLGFEVGRLKIVPSGEADAIYSDIFVRDPAMLIEAKGSAKRSFIRMALGQLLDYHRFEPTARRAILVPERPRPDLLDFTRQVGIAVYWPEGEEYGSSLPDDWTKDPIGRA